MFGLGLLGNGGEGGIGGERGRGERELSAIQWGPCC
jgi:hypothetical protein